jgi:phosphoserine phosphatase RsbU/P
MQDDSGMQNHEDRKIEDLQTVLEVTRALAATTDLETLLPAIERAARQVLRCERATMFLFDPERNELLSRIATGVEQIRFPADKGIAGHVVQTGQSLNVPDAYKDPRFNPQIDRETGFRTRSILSVPLYNYSGQLMGVLQALNKADGCFETYDEWLAVVLSAQAGVALQRQKLLLEYATKQRMQRDLDIARTIQQQILPKQAPHIAGFDIAGWNRPADETGGDYFDFYQRTDGSVAISVADAAGHGIGPALVTVECRALLRASLDGGDLQGALAKVNNLLCADLPAERFVTAFVSLVGPGAEEIPYVAAGHGPALVLRTDGSVEPYDSTGIPLGILTDFPFETAQTIRLRRGDCLAIVTDGLFEWRNPQGEEYGTDRLAQTLSRHRELTSAEMIAKTYDELLCFAQGEPASDDLTAVIIKRL